MAGETVFKGEITTTCLDSSIPYYVTQATLTGLEVDGIAMARIGSVLVPASEYVATKTEAKQQVVEKLIGIVGSLQATIDRLKDEVLHETLTQEAA